MPHNLRPFDNLCATAEKRLKKETTIRTDSSPLCLLKCIILISCRAPPRRLSKEQCASLLPSFACSLGARCLLPYHGRVELCSVHYSAHFCPFARPRFSGSFNYHFLFWSWTTNLKTCALCPILKIDTIWLRLQLSTKLGDNERSPEKTCRWLLPASKHCCLSSSACHGKRKDQKIPCVLVLSSFRRKMERSKIPCTQSTTVEPVLSPLFFTDAPAVPFATERALDERGEFSAVLNTELRRAALSWLCR